MMHSRKLGAIGAAAICIAAGCAALAQGATAADDDQGLLNLLEELSPEAPEEKAAPAAAKPAQPAAGEKKESASAPAVPAQPPSAEEPAAAPAAGQPAAEPPAAAGRPEAAKPDQAPPAKQEVEKPREPADETVELIRKTEENRIKALIMQMDRELGDARSCKTALDFLEAARHFAKASQYAKLLAGTPGSDAVLKECRAEVPECLYQAGLQEYALGRTDRAVMLMEKARNHGHANAQATIDGWMKAPDPDENKTDVSEVLQVRNEGAQKAKRDENSRHLKRAVQFFGIGNLSEALNECETVLKSDPYNTDALRIRGMIQKKRQTVAKTERKAARDGMIADVDEAWRPVYAINVRETEPVKNTRKRVVGPEDAQRTLEQSIIKRMKDMKLPAISFKPPATIIDAVGFFRQMSIECDDPNLPQEQRGFNFTLRTPETLKAQQAAAPDAGGAFSEDDGETSGAPAGVPVIPMISASNISLYDALKLVCDSVQYKFAVQGPVVIVMHKEATIEEMTVRSYPVMPAFKEKVDKVSEDLQSMGGRGGAGGGFGRGGQNDTASEEGGTDWKRVFTELGVQWPEGSSIFYMAATGKLRVRNTIENLTELEKALIDLNAEPKLIEIEARFVEVCQEDLNSLGFEWILNSDYSLNLGSHISRALGLRRGVFGSQSGSTSMNSETVTSTSSTMANNGGVVTATGGGVVTTGGGTTTSGGSTSSVATPATTWSRTVNQTLARTTYLNSNGASWIRGEGSAHHNRNVGINGFGGASSDYTTGQRYLSTLGNHISGEGYSQNDQFMKVNAFLGGADLSLILHMLSQRSDTDLLSAPKVLTRPGEEAVIKVVTEYRYPTDYDVQLQSSSSGGSYNSSSQSSILAVVEPQSFETRNVGVTLDVTPSLTDDGNLIDLKLDVEVVDEPTWKNYGMRIPYTGNSSLQSFEGIGTIFDGLANVLGMLGTGLSETMRASFADKAVNSATTALDSLSQSGDNITYYDAPMEQPFFHVRKIESSVSVYPGATIVMGGLITEQRKAMDDKIPFLGDLPFIGRLFRSHSEMTNKRNLLVFVTTRLVDARGRNIEVGTLEVKDDGAVKAAPEPDAE